MVDRNRYEAELAQKVHDCERSVGLANAMPAGPQRIERINRADLELIKAQQTLDHCLSGQASAPIKVQR
jgi:hypothetical protein